MPPVMMTAVIPSAMIATNAKLRVTLNRFCCVANTSLITDRMTKATNAAMETQNACRLTSQLSRLPCACLLIDCSRLVAISARPVCESFMRSRSRR